MLALTGMGFDLNFPANRLKQAYGEAACSVLNFLTDKALSATGFVWRRPVYAAEDAVEEAEPVDDCDMADIADEAEVEEEQEDEQDFSDLIKAEEDDDMRVSDIQAAMLEAKVDPVEWKRELERVGPKLKVRQHPHQHREEIGQARRCCIALGATALVLACMQMAASAAGKEWRGHVEQTKKHEEAIQAALPVTTTQLALIGTELHDELKAVELKHQTTSGSVGELTESLAALSDELQELKEKMDSKGDAMSEASPLVSIKQALQQIKAEIKTFDLQIGVVSHTLLSTKIRRSKANSPKGSRGGGTNSSSRRTAGIGEDDEEDFDMSDSGED
ncbi:unnamed protein product [Ectocarpus sp. CCAP 1310/34]|nr:unnamed protein product [Ectocarpus sp. CCAP 1310/34]